uniref:Uncharacterized protein n=1 Tax=Magallana gigas TaxID=29159 RepID=K1PEP1_MAGGI
MMVYCCLFTSNWVFSSNDLKVLCSNNQKIWERVMLQSWLMFAFSVTCVVLQIMSIIFGYRYFKKSADGYLGIFKGVVELFRSMFYTVSHNRYINEKKMPNYNNTYAMYSIISAISLAYGCYDTDSFSFTSSYEQTTSRSNICDGFGSKLYVQPGIIAAYLVMHILLDVLNLTFWIGLILMGLIPGYIPNGFLEIISRIPISFGSTDMESAVLGVIIMILKVVVEFLAIKILKGFGKTRVGIDDENINLHRGTNPQPSFKIEQNKVSNETTEENLSNQSINKNENIVPESEINVPSNISAEENLNNQQHEIDASEMRPLVRKRDKRFQNGVTKNAGDMRFIRNPWARCKNLSILIVSCTLMIRVLSIGYVIGTFLIRFQDPFLGYTGINLLNWCNLGVFPLGSFINALLFSLIPAFILKCCGADDRIAFGNLGCSLVSADACFDVFSNTINTYGSSFIAVLVVNCLAEIIMIVGISSLHGFYAVLFKSTSAKNMDSKEIHKLKNSAIGSGCLSLKEKWTRNKMSTCFGYTSVIFLMYCCLWKDTSGCSEYTYFTTVTPVLFIIASDKVYKRSFSTTKTSLPESKLSQNGSVGLFKEALLKTKRYPAVATVVVISIVLCSRNRRSIIERRATV